jgi:outer membrane protein insertion porin family
MSMTPCGQSRLDVLRGGRGLQFNTLRTAAALLALLASGVTALVSSGQSLPPTGPLNAPYGAPPTNALPPGAPPGATTDQRQLVVEVQVLGNSGTKDYEIQKHIHTRAEREFDPELVQADVRRLVTTGLFRDVKTFTRPAAGGVIVIFEVFERPRIHRILFLGNHALSEKQLTKEIGLKVGDPLNSYSCEEARRKVEELYHAKGNPTATVSLLEGDQPGDKDLVLLINEGQVERIAWVTFDGNTVASDARLKTQIESKPGFLWYFFKGKVDRTKIDADVEKLTAYYRSLGYFRARVGRELNFDDSGKWLSLNFIIDEGPRYVVRNVSVEGNKKFANKPLLGFLQLKSGDYFNQAEMNRDLNTLVDIYGSQGHVFADVQADPRFLEEPGQIDLVYRIQEGQVFSVSEINVNIAGEFPHTRQTVVLNRLGFRPGDVLDTRKIRDAERRLKASQLFTVNPQEGEPPKIVVRPPDPLSIGSLAEQPQPGTVRGQDPGGDVVDRYFPPRPAPPAQTADQTNWSPYR